MSASMLFSHRPAPAAPTQVHESGPSLADRVAWDLNRLRSKPERPSTIRVKRSALQPASKAELQQQQHQQHPQLSSRQLADQRLEQALGGQFDYIGARSMLHRLARSQPPSTAARSAEADGALSESIMTRVRSLAAATEQHASLALSERAAQEAARRRSRTKPAADPHASIRTKPPPIPLSDLPPSMIPVPRPSITHFAAQHTGPPSPTPTTATASRRTDRERERERDKSPLRAPNKFYNVRVSQNPIFLRRTSIKPPHLSSLPIPAPPLPAPPMAATLHAPRPRSPVRRPKPAPAPAPMTGSVRPSARSARTTSVALQTYLAVNPPVDPRPTPAPNPAVVHHKSMGVQADDAPTRDAKDSWSMTDPPALVDRATAASPVHVGGRTVACQADFGVAGPAVSSVASQTVPERGRGRTVALDTRDLVRPANVAVQTEGVYVEARDEQVARADEDWVGQAQAELMQWIEMQVLLRLVADDTVDRVAADMVAELVRDVVARWPVAAGTQAEWPVEQGVQAVEEAKAVADGATQVTPSITPPRMITPDVSEIAGIELGVQTSFGSLPTINELGEEEQDEDVEVDLYFDQATQASIHPILSNASVQVTPAPSSPTPSTSTIDEPTPTPRLLTVPPVTPAEETSYHSIGVQRTRTPTPPPPSLPATPSPPPPARVPTPGLSLPPPSSIHPSTPRTSSPGLVPEPSATTIHTCSASMSMSMDVSEGEVVTGLYSDGELLSGILAPSAIPGMRHVSADTTADEGGGFGAGGHLVAHRHGDELGMAVEWVREQDRVRRKRRVVQRMRLKGLSQRMAVEDSVEASLETSGISLDDGEGGKAEASMWSVGEEQGGGGDVSMGEVVGTVVQESAGSSDASDSESSDSESQSPHSGSGDAETVTATALTRSEGELQVESEETFDSSSQQTDDSSTSSSSGDGPLPPGPSGPAVRRPAPFLSTFGS